jgi:hypothetical protein
MTFIQAAHFYPGRRKPIRLLVLHDMEASVTGTTAENVARYFAQADSRKASAHYCIDNNSIVQCVRDGDTAWAAEGANSDGLHFELAGYARQTADQWLDVYGKALLSRTAYLVAAKSLTYGIPVRHLTVQQIRNGELGICGHADITAAYPPGTGHTDPGPNFPWTYFLGLVRAAVTDLQPKPAPPPAPTQEDDMYAVVSDPAGSGDYGTNLVTKFPFPSQEAKNEWDGIVGAKRITLTAAAFDAIPTVKDAP